MDAQDPLERVQCGDPPRNGAICNLHIIYFGLTTFATPKNHLFRSLLPSQTGKLDKNRVPHRGRQKDLKNRGTGGTIVPNGGHTVLQGSPGCPRIRPKSLKN